MPATGLKMKISRKQPFVRSFAFRLALSYGAVFSLVLIVSGFYLTRYLEKQTFERLRESLSLQARLLTYVVTPETIREGNAERIQALTLSAGEISSARIVVVNQSGEVLGDSKETQEDPGDRETLAERPEIKTVLSGVSSSHIAYSKRLGAEVLYAAVPVKEGDSVVGAIRMSLPLKDIAEDLEDVRHPVWVGTAAGIALVFVLGLWLGRKVSRRISQMTWAAARYARGDLNEKVLIDGRDEIQTLGDSLNKMAQAIRSRMGEFEAERTKLSAILGNMSEGVMAVDKNRQVLLANPSAEQIFDVQAGAAVGKSLMSLTKKPQLDELMSRAIREGKSAVQEIEIVQPNGTRVLQANAVGFSEAADLVAGIMVLSDMTKVRRLENLRREFVANVSHELKTPLTSIRGFIETLLSGALEDVKTSERFLRLMEDDAGRLERLIQDLLEISRLEDKQVHLKLQAVDLSEEAAHAVEHLQPQLKEKAIRIENRISGALPSVQADRDRIRQVFLNLLDNAIKFNRPEGWIRMEAFLENGSVKILIEDSGIGIPSQAKGRIFERFFRVDKARSREMGGTGLGLSIVKHIVEVHGGEVACESEYGKGSKFYFSLPVFRDAAAFRG